MTASPGGGSWKQAAGLLLFSLPIVLCGVFLALVGFGLIPPMGETYAPGWVLAAVGLVFLAPGFAMMAGALRALLTRSPLGHPAVAWTGMVVAATLTFLASSLGGVAFFGDARGFRGSITIPGVTLFSRPGSTHAVTGGRIVFGIAAALVGSLALLFWVISVSALRARRRAGAPPSRSLDMQE